ncbi:hypothetical protein HDK77DRAFT_434554 [Phyllosticta capitalensis]|uniref:EthD domain-containing protein n=1 Tax=Phyllosticta capitalensis TaxID=121624 RepID=A0ABR1Z0C0_9PEZI
MPPFIVQVVYPNVSDATFNYDHYLQVHMPLAEKVWRPHGLIGYRALKIVATAPKNDPPPYTVMCLLEFPDRKSWDDCIAVAAKDLVPDIPNFSNKEPVFLIGEQFAGSVGVSRK